MAGCLAQQATKSAKVEKLLSAYLFAKQMVIDLGFEAEITWQENLDFSAVTEAQFLRESAWVILSSGMREAVIRGKFQGVSEAFLFWESAKAITLNRDRCQNKALETFRSEGKITAIGAVATFVYDSGFEWVKTSMLKAGPDFLDDLPYLGPATSRHLAKNLGMPVAKPDRHLTRIAQCAGYSSVQDFCDRIALELEEKASVVDLVLWRFATLKQDYLQVLFP